MTVNSPVMIGDSFRLLNLDWYKVNYLFIKFDLIQLFPQKSNFT